MNKKQLTQFADLTLEIALLEKRLSRMDTRQEQVDWVKGSSPEFPYAQVNYTIRGVEESPKATRLRQRLSQQLAKSKAMEEEIERWIYGIDEAGIRNIMHLRYLQGRTWTQIATELHAPSEDSVRKKHDRYLQRQEAS